jgi:type IV secretion system protein VirB8
MTSTNADLPPHVQGEIASGDAARAHYYETASSWAQDTHASLRASRRTAWIIASVAVGVAGLQAIAMAFLLPLKQSVPYTITVDRETGYVQTARGVDLGPISESEAIAQSFAVQYVLARETFEASDYQDKFRKTLMWSQGAAETEYRRDWDKSNPVGIQSRVRPTTRIKVTVKSVTILGPRSAMVRFDTEQSEGPSSGGMRQPWVASMTYSFSGKPVSEQDRYMNPLGYQVATYRRDAETTQPVNVPAPPPPMPTTTPTLVPGNAGMVPGTDPAATPTNGVVSPATNGVAAPTTTVPITTPSASPPRPTGNPNGEEFPAQ